MHITTSSNDIKERLSFAFACTIAARAGCAADEPSGPDKQSIDVTIKAVSGKKTPIFFQLKATELDNHQGSDFFYDLPKKNYDNLREEGVHPHYLVILFLPKQKRSWLLARPMEIAIRTRAYFANLSGLPATTNTFTQRIYIPRTQIFGVSVLSEMIAQAPNMIGTAKIIGSNSGD